MSPWTLLAGVVLIAGAAAGGYYEGHKNEANVMAAQINAIKAADAIELAASDAKVIVQQQADAQHLAVIQQTHEEDLAHAKANYDSNLAALRAGTLKMRKEWSCTPALASAVSKAAAGGPSTDAAAQLRFQGASDLVRNDDTADAEIKALQAIVAQDRSTQP
jgi:hypothetical protein